MAATSRRRPWFSALTLAFVFSAGSALAAVNSSFVWGFGPYGLSVFPECGRMQIKKGTLPNIMLAPKPPYTLIAYEEHGVATAQTLGSDEGNLWWTVDHAAGARLALSMADAAGNSGGISPVIYTVFANSSTNSSCHPSNPTSKISVMSNTTSLLNTCDVLALAISGGKRPYTITIASTKDAIVSNITMGSAYDTYHWVSRTSPNSSVIASISDATGAYASGTVLLNTTGGLDHTCNGLQSTQLDSTGKSPPVPLGDGLGNSPTATPNPSSGPATGPIIGGVLGGLAILGASITGMFFCLRKRRAKGHPDEDGGYTEAGLRGIVPFRVSNRVGAQINTSGPTQYASAREKALPLEPVGDGIQPPPREGAAVFQHADISDVVELPPAYRDRAT